MNRKNCPNCGRRNCDCDRDLVDLVLTIGGAFDWVTPASELSGYPAGCWLILCVFAIAAVFASKGVLWG